MVAGQLDVHLLAHDDRVTVGERPRSTAPIASAAACGGTISASALRAPSAPKSLTVNVPPASSGEVIVPSRARPVRLRDSAAICSIVLSFASKIVGVRRPPGTSTTSPMLTREYRSKCPSR